MVRTIEVGDWGEGGGWMWGDVIIAVITAVGTGLQMGFCGGGKGGGWNWGEILLSFFVCNSFQT